MPDAPAVVPTGEGAGIVHRPRVLSKTLQSALGCEWYFAHRYLTDDYPRELAPSVGCRVGMEFHAYRSALVQHLAEAQRRSDPEWVQEYNRCHPLEDETRDLIAEDATFELAFDSVVGVEWYIAVDSEFRVVSSQDQCDRGRLPARTPEVAADGVLDLVLVEDSRARIVDHKTSWYAGHVAPYEALHYAALALAALRHVNEVLFEWDFIRAKAPSGLRLYRSELPRVHHLIRQERQRMLDLTERFAQGKPMYVDPTAGLCGSCPFACPLRRDVWERPLAFEPIQNDADAKEVARRVLLAAQYNSVGRALLKNYLAEHAQGSVAVDQYVAKMQPGLDRKFPLDKVLEVLGFSLGPDSKSWDVPLSSLHVSATDLKAKAKTKKRIGLWEELDRIADKRPTSELWLGPPKDGER